MIVPAAPAQTLPEFRRFGPFGPVYEVLEKDLDETTLRRRQEVRVRVVESGEELLYPVVDLLADPAA